MEKKEKKIFSVETATWISYLFIHIHSPTLSTDHPLMITIGRRFFSRSALSGKQITIAYNNVHVVKNIQDREYDLLWKTVDSQRSDIKKTDLKKFKEAFGDDYHQAFTFVRNTDRLVATNTHIVFHPFRHNEGWENLVFRGKLWISPDVHGSQILSITADQSYDAGFSVGNHSMGFVTNKSYKTMKAYKHMFGSTDMLQKYYVSHYDFGDLCMPKNLNTDGIFIKNARDVPDKDIVDYDSQIFQYERSKYVLGQLREDFGRVAYNDHGEVVGFGAVSVYPSGECTITPMYADDTRIARTILKSILEEMSLDPEKYWRLKLHSHDHTPESYGWIRPFVKTMTHRTEICTLMCDHKEDGMDFKKVFSMFHPSTCPI
ncbi:hypothetical protein B9Z55_006239 [Caenorhabditis nigoni]|uniref:DUF1248 domain-containing protein n=1 Tax=Caenorhabditis nigoni TaxID=1611254 RepID=A0A2G5V4C8_9PELO|nr:hypothetical protein B9Z55_006239 [Caenorhabditis nigoni]